MIWEPGGIFTTTCLLDITYYPFDYQVCDINVGNWEYRKTQVDLNVSKSGFTLDYYRPNGEWDIIKTEAISSRILINQDTSEYMPRMVFRLYMGRKSLYYWMDVIIPALLISLLVHLVYLLPPDSGEKVSLAVTLLLSYSVFLMMISENVPSTSTSVPLVGETVYVSGNLVTIVSLC